MPRPPIAARHPHQTTIHGETLDDPYAWLRDPAYPEVRDPEILAYLHAENAYFDGWRQRNAQLIGQLTAELRARLVEDDASVPFRDGAYLYWWAYAPGTQYRDWYRRPIGGGEAVLILSENALAAGHAYFRLGAFAVSPDARLLAYSTDCAGTERFTLRVRDLDSGADIATIATDSLGEAVWDSAARTLVWAQASAEWRPTKIWRSDVATNARHLVYEEPEAGFWVQPQATQDRRHILLISSTQTSSEIRVLDAAAVEQPPVVVRRRQPDLRYSLDMRGDQLFILANDTHVNFRIATATLANPGAWQTLIAGSNDIYLTGLTAFASFLAIEDRVQGLEGVRLRFADGREQRLQFPEQSYSVALGTNAEADAPQLRLRYSSMVTPDTIFDHDVASGALTARKVMQIPSGYDAAHYRTERLYAPARDGARIPVSIVYRADYRRDGSMPLHVYGYGAYGIAIAPAFSRSRLSLIDRGFACAIAHVRGGDDLGYQWYLDGKLAQRHHAFDDFVDVTRFLHAQGFGRPGQTAATGGSAGGWLMGAAMLQAPELWGAIVAHVPFVDIVNTMLDDSLPLTAGEWPEWGNPKTDATAFRRLRALSPYEQTRPGRYPPMLITGGLSDPRVTYWEPAKWAARIRHANRSDSLILLKINMGAGHAGQSGRFQALDETAEEHAFIIEALAGHARQQ